jgi:diguanylate cyclase
MFHPAQPSPVATAGEYALPIAVLCLELDGIKALTWAKDLATDDDLLAIVAARLTRALADDDVLHVLNVLGDGQFACLLTGLPDRERLCHLAWKLLDAAAAPVILGSIRFTLHPWIGIALWPTAGANCAQLFRNARAAMYRARHQKSGYAFFDEHTDVWEQVN